MHMPWSSSQYSMTAALVNEAEEGARKLHVIVPDPTPAPSSVPTTESPTGVPTTKPTGVPSALPTSPPTGVPTSEPSGAPTQIPTGVPTSPPSSVPSPAPTNTFAPTPTPTGVPTGGPSVPPTAAPTHVPTTEPTGHPSVPPTPGPSGAPTSVPSSAPTSVPSSVPTTVPTGVPTSDPTKVPTVPPTSVPTVPPTSDPTKVPTTAPTSAPTSTPTSAPTHETWPPTEVPSSVPTGNPTGTPTSEPTISAAPTFVPTPVPTEDNFGSCWHKITGLVTCMVRKKVCNSPEHTLDGGGISYATTTDAWDTRKVTGYPVTGSCNPDHYADSEAKKLRAPTMAPTTPSALPTADPRVAPTYETEPPTSAPSPAPTMTFVATDANLACDHTHDPPDLVGITTATDGTCAVHLYLHHYDVFVQTYGASPIDQWDTSQVTDMSHLFENELDFNEDISGWNVDAVTSMHDMFLHAESFDQDLGWCIEEACPAIDDENETYEEYKARIAPLQAGCNGANGQPCCVDMTDAFFYSPCILRTGANGGTCGVKNTEGACQPTPMPTTAAPTIDWTTFCETKNTPSACTAEVGCHWLDPYSR